jgi:hypothetical protein
MYINIDNKIIKASLFLGLLCLIAFVISGYSFLHYHVTPSGVIKIHSHPFENSYQDSGSENAAEKHNHNNTDYYYAKNIVNFDKFILSAVPIVISTLEEEGTRTFSHTEIVVNIFSYNYSFRAPLCS